MNQIVQMVYVSSTVGLMSEKELLHLLVSARNRNSKHGITGMLLYSDGNVMQVIEGEESSINQLFSNIVSDGRHSGIIVLYIDVIPEPEFSEFMTSGSSLEPSSLLASKAKKLLNQFRA